METNTCTDDNGDKLEGSDAKTVEGVIDADIEMPHL